MINDSRMKKVKKTIAVIGVIALLVALFLDVNDIRNLFKKRIDITGEWKLKFRIQESSYSQYVDKVAEYKVYFIQEGNKINGQGEKWKFDEKFVPYSEHSPLIIEGKYKNDTIYCKYILKGSLRETTGNFKAFYDNGKLIGSFSGTGADAKGLIFGDKIR